jgi:hypothetical protein
MTPADSERFAQVLATLGEVFDAPPSPGRLEAYYQVLEHLPIEAVESAGLGALRECRFFPRPAELLAFAGDNPTDAGALAWLATIAACRDGYWDSVTFDDPTIVPTVRHVFGSWPQAVNAYCDLSEPALQGKRKEFLAVYQAIRLHPMTRAEYLPGMLEAQNRGTAPTWTRLDQPEQRIRAYDRLGRSRYVPHPAPLTPPAPTPALTESNPS